MKEKINDKKLALDIIASERLKSLINAKVKENKELEEMLGEIEQKLDSVNKSIEYEIKAELDLISAEKGKMEKARELLVKPPVIRRKKNTFIISGKIIDESNKIGLPGLLIKISGSIDEKQKELFEAHSNSYGNFVAAISLKDLTNLKSIKPILTLSVYSDSETLIHREDVDTPIKSEGLKMVTLEVPCGANLQDRRDSGKNIRDGFDEVEKNVLERFENMKGYITPIKSLIKMNREDIHTLRNELSTPPPDISTLFEEPIAEKPEKEIKPTSEPAAKESWDNHTRVKSTVKKREFPTTKEKIMKINLENINGIGPERARKLRRAGIKNAVDFSKTEVNKLRAILGNINVGEMKKDCKTLLKKVSQVV